MQKIETLVATVDRKPGRGATKRDADEKTAATAADDDIGEKRKRLKEQFFGAGSVESHRDRLLADRSMNSESSADEKVDEEDLDWMLKGLDLPGRKKGKRVRKANTGLTASPTKGTKSPRGRGRGRGGSGRGSRGGGSGSRGGGSGSRGGGSGSRGGGSEGRGAIRGRKPLKTPRKPYDESDSD